MNKKYVVSTEQIETHTGKGMDAEQKTAHYPKIEQIFDTEEEAEQYYNSIKTEVYKTPGWHPIYIHYCKILEVWQENEDGELEWYASHTFEYPNYVEEVRKDNEELGDD